MRIKQKFVNVRLWLACCFEYNKLLDGELLGRGFGKTYVLLKLAKEFKYPIIVPTIRQAQHLRLMAQTHFGGLVDIDIQVMTPDSIPSLKCMRLKTCLVDEGFTIAQIRVLRKEVSHNHVVIGYF